MFAPSSAESIRSGLSSSCAPAEGTPAEGTPAEGSIASPKNTAVRSTCAALESTARILIPARNEAATIGHVVRGCRHAGFSVTVIDDASSDGTALLAAQAGAEVLTIRGPHHG